MVCICVLVNSCFIKNPSDMILDNNLSFYDGGITQGSMTVKEYLNQFTQLSRYAMDDVNTDEKKQDMFLNGLNDEIQFELLNTNYEDFQHLEGDGQ
jgi:hypothetical protein